MPLFIAHPDGQGDFTPSLRHPPIRYRQIWQQVARAIGWGPFDWSLALSGLPVNRKGLET